MLSLRRDHTNIQPADPLASLIDEILGGHASHAVWTTTLAARQRAPGEVAARFEAGNSRAIGIMLTKRRTELLPRLSRVCSAVGVEPYAVTRDLTAHVHVLAALVDLRGTVTQA